MIRFNQTSIITIDAYAYIEKFSNDDGYTIDCDELLLYVSDRQWEGEEKKENLLIFDAEIFILELIVQQMNNFISFLFLFKIGRFN